VHDVDIGGQNLSIVAMGPRDVPQDFGDEGGARTRWRTTTSEAIGYGLYLLATAAKNGAGDGQEQAIFDKMWRFSQAMPSPSSPAHDGVHLMSWLWDPDSEQYRAWLADPLAGKRLLGSAADGDIWIARALMIANQVWGSDGEQDYARRARATLELIKTYTIGPDSNLILLGDWVAPNLPIQASTPGCTITRPIHGQYVTRTSDFVWSFFADFYAWTGDERWLAVIRATQREIERIQAKYASKLVPDIVIVDGEQVRGADFDVFCDNTESGLDRFGWNAVRNPIWWTIAAQQGTPEFAAKKSRDILHAMGRAMLDRGAIRPSQVGYEHSIADGKSAGAEYVSELYLASFLAALSYANPADDQRADVQAAVDELFSAVASSRFDDEYFGDTVALIGLDGLLGQAKANATTKASP
jgi:endo-1,4-beta-D-glucanase Y